MGHAGSRDIDIAIPRLFDSHPKVNIFEEHEEAFIETVQRTEDFAVDKQESARDPPHRARIQIGVCPKVCRGPRVCRPQPSKKRVPNSNSDSRNCSGRGVHHIERVHDGRTENTGVGESIPLGQEQVQSVFLEPGYQDYTPLPIQSREQGLSRQHLLQPRSRDLKAGG